MASPAGQTILTPNIITKEALRILHANLNFIGSLSRQYDSRFAVSGAKIGQTLDVRLPPKYTTRTGAALSTQATVQRKVTLPVATMKGVDVDFTSTELTMSLNDFSRDVLQPAMSQLASTIEADALTMINSVPNYAGTVASQIDYRKFQQAGQFMTENLAPLSQRSALLTPASRVEFSDAVKGLFQDSSAIAEQYKEGIVGRTGGFDVYESTLLPAYNPGTFGGTPLTNGATQGNAGTNNAYVATSAIITDGWTATTTSLNVGAIITFGGVFEVHPETKVSIGRLKRFTVTAATVTDGSGNSTITVSPGAIYGGAYQNISNSIGDGSAITVLGTSTVSAGQNLMYHRDAFAFATADLEDVSNYGTWGSRMVQDGISMRIARQYDINTDNVPCRIDVLYGFVPLYPELASRVVYQLT